MFVSPFFKLLKLILLKYNLHTITCTHFKCTAGRIWAIVYICETTTSVKIGGISTPPPKVLLYPFLAQAFHNSFKNPNQEVVSVMISVGTLLISCSSQPRSYTTLSLSVFLFITIRNLAQEYFYCTLSKKHRGK